MRCSPATVPLIELTENLGNSKHALTLQMHTAHILSAHASLDQKKRATEDVKEQRQKCVYLRLSTPNRNLSLPIHPYRLDSERTRLLTALQAVNADRDQADLLEITLNKECVSALISFDFHH